MSFKEPCCVSAGVCIVLLTLCAPASYAQDMENVPAYTLEQCVEIGIQRSVPLANARRDEMMAHEQIRQTRAQVFPSLEFNSSYTRLDEVPSFEGIGDIGRADNYMAAANAEQLLYSGGGVRAALRAAKQYKQFSAEEVTRQRAALVRDITKLFYEVLYTKEAVDVAATSVEQLSKFEQQTKLKFENDAASEFDWLSAQVKVANEKPKLIQARNNYSLTKTAFRDLIYLEEEEFQLSGELEYHPVETDLETLYELAMANRPEIIQAQLFIQMRSEDVRVSKSDYLPEIRAFANYQGDNPTQDFPAQEEWEWHWNAGLSASWSILDGGLRRSEIRSKRLAEQKARAELEDLLLNVRLEIKNAFLTLNHAREVVMSTQDSVALAQKAMSIARVRYDEGLATYLEFTDSNLALSNARLIHLMALRGYAQALADLRYACGTVELSQNEEMKQ